MLKSKFAILLLLAIAIMSCDSNSSKRADSTFLGGEIINPFSNKVLLLKNDAVFDTIALDSRNRFLYEFEDFTPGVYRFSHGEHQLFHIEEGDSIMLRVNTLEFDESLSFSGIGAQKNNFLIDLYLQYEKENKGMTKKYQKNPQDFTVFLDSMLAVRQKMYSRFLEKNDISASFKEVAETALRFDNFHRKETYPFSHYGKNKLDLISSLPEDFYRFRESVDLNNENISELYAFQRYAVRYFNHLAFLEYGDKKPYNTVSYVHNLKRLKIIDSLITNPDVKDVFLTRSVEIFISNSNNVIQTQHLFDLYNEYVSSPVLKNKVKELYTLNEKMHVGHTIPDQIVVDTEGRLMPLRRIVKKPTVLYFWSYNRHAHLENSHKKVKDLASKYPEYDFIGININSDTEKWVSSLKLHNFSKENEFQFSDPQKARKELVINAQGKAIVLDKNGVILTSHGNLYRVEFEQELLAFLNR